MTPSLFLRRSVEPNPDTHTNSDIYADSDDTPARIIVSIHACRAAAQRRRVYSCLLFSCIQFEIDFYVVVIAFD